MKLVFKTMKEKDETISDKKLKIDIGTPEKDPNKVTLDLGNGKIFTFSPKREEGKVNNNNITVGDFPCNECGSKFETKRKLYNHKRSHDTTENLCNSCGKGFAGKRTLESHKRTHLKFKCEKCKKVVTWSYKDRHSRICNPEKTYPCKICHGHFDSPFSLKQHKWKVHVIERKCSKCTKEQILS